MIIRLMILALLSITLVKAIRTGAISYPRLSVGPAICTFLVLAVLSTLCSPYTHQSIQWLLVLLSYVGLLYWLVIALETWGEVTGLLAVLLGMGLIETGLVLVQAFWWRVERPSGTFFNPNFLAGYLAAIWTIAFGVMCHVRTGRRSVLRAGLISRGGLILCLALMGVSSMAIVWTGSRGGGLALLAGTAFVLCVRFRLRGVSVLAVVLLVGLLIPNPIRDRIWTEHVANPVGYARWQIWQSSARIMVDHPFGVGLGLYQYIYPRYMFPVEGQIMRYGRVAHTAHNEYLQMGVELGIISIPIFCWGIAAIAREAKWVLHTRLRRWQRGLVVGVCAAAAGMLVHAAVDSNFHDPAITVLFVTCVGIILSAKRFVGRGSQALYAIATRPRRVWLAFGTLVVAGLAIGTVRLGVAWMFYEAGSRAASQQDFARAVVRYETAITLDPWKSLYHSALAATHFRLFEQTRSGQAAQFAVTELQSAIKLNPLDGRLYGLLGHVYSSLAWALGTEDVQQEQKIALLRTARTAYARALNLEPFSPFYRLELGRLAFAAGEREEAESSVKKAIELEPNFLPGRLWLAQLYLLDNSRSEKALQELKEIMERQRQFAGWAKNEVEERFLQVNVSVLQRELERMKAHI